MLRLRHGSLRGLAWRGGFLSRSAKPHYTCQAEGGGDLRKVSRRRQRARTVRRRRQGDGGIFVGAAHDPRKPAPAKAGERLAEIFRDASPPRACAGASFGMEISAASLAKF